MKKRKRVEKKPVASDGAKSSLPHHAGPEAWAALGSWGLLEAGDCHFTLRLALPCSPQDGRMEESRDGSKNEEHLRWTWKRKGMRQRTQKEEVKMRKMITTERKVGRRVTLPRTEKY